jgi:hypothetical protein
MIEIHNFQCQLHLYILLYGTDMEKMQAPENWGGGVAFAITTFENAHINFP